MNPPAGTSGYLQVSRGVSGKDTYIPLESVTHRTDGRVYMNVPKLGAGKLPWSEPPSDSELSTKYGPKPETVNRLYRSYHFGRDQEQPGGSGHAQRRKYAELLTDAGLHMREIERTTTPARDPRRLLRRDHPVR